MFVFVLKLPYLTCNFLICAGAVYFKFEMPSIMESASLNSSVVTIFACRALPAIILTCPALTSRRLLPIFVICEVTFASVPFPTATITITAHTPTIIPESERTVLILRSSNIFFEISIFFAIFIFDLRLLLGQGLPLFGQGKSRKKVL